MGYVYFFCIFRLRCCVRLHLSKVGWILVEMSGHYKGGQTSGRAGGYSYSMEGRDIAWYSKARYSKVQQVQQGSEINGTSD